MKRDQYLKLHKDFCDRMVAMTARKNADYTGGTAEDDAFANFTLVEAMGVASTEQGFLTRMLDKFARINTYVKKGTLQVADESVEDTLLDLANYSLLLAGHLRDKRDQTVRALTATNLNPPPAPARGDRLG